MGVVIISTLLSLNSIACTVFALRIIKNTKSHTAPIPTSRLGFETDMPSVTVCIPARNEEHALAECLQQVINSTYEKIEVIVLDDSSSDGTSLLIKSFAHAGVRFVRGSTLPAGWLGKNHSLKELVDEANGSYVLFLDVDTRLGPGAVENMVRATLTNGKQMLSAIPRRTDGLRASVLWSPLKYYWELVRHRPTSPAAASNAWIIKRSTAQKFFSEDAEFIKNAVMPEAYIASKLGDESGFVVGTKELGVSYEKKWSSQVSTSIRLLYPMLQSHPALAFATTLGLLSLLTPYIVLASLPFTEPSLIHLAAAFVALGFSALYGFYTKTLWNTGWQVAMVIWPLIALQEAILTITSMVRYLQGRILWKGRPIRSIQPTLR